TAAPARPRTISSRMAAQLVTVVPKFDPALAVKPPETAPDGRETEKSRATIVRLPPVIVREEKRALPKKHEMLTLEGRLALARKKYPGIHVVVPILSFLLNTDGVALAMLAEDERLEQKREFEEMAELTRLTDPANAEKMTRVNQEVFMRRPDFGL
ncbi:MAG: hypothetical protein ABIR80_13820, partial [Opitutaceae bacterium]